MWVRLKMGGYLPKSKFDTDNDVPLNVQRNMFGVSNIMVIRNSGLPHFRDTFRGMAVWQWSLGSCVSLGKVGARDAATGEMCGLRRGFDGILDEFCGGNMISITLW